MAIYIWKILEGNVPNFSPPINCHISAHRGRLCNSGVVPTGHLGTLCHNSFRSKATTIFNCLPKHIRNLVNCANTSIFKRALDYHLCSIEDSPMEAMVRVSHRTAVFSSSIMIHLEKPLLAEVFRN